MSVLSPRPEKWAALALLALGFWLLWRATAEQSFTLDEPYHLVAGLQMHQHGTNTVNLDHPPLVKWIAAWPLANEPALQAKPLRVDEVRGAWMALFADPGTTRRYLLESRGAVLVAFVLPLLALIYLWGRRYGPRVGFLLLATFLLAPITLPYLPLVMTDAAVTLGFVATVMAATLFAERPSTWRALILGLALGLALATKFSGLLLLPTVAAALFLAARKTGWKRLGGHAVLLAATAFLLLYGSYALANPVGESALVLRTVNDYLAVGGSPDVGAQLVIVAPLLHQLASVSPELGQYLTGVFWLHARDQVGVFASVAFGQLSSEGRWWYFPALLLIQTPLILLAAAGLTLYGAIPAAAPTWRERWRKRLREPAFVLPAITALFYFATACLSNYNLGLRHLLPIMPLLLLPIAVWASKSQRRILGLLGVLALESLLVAPLWMSTTNTWWLGQANPSRMAFSAFEYKQTLIALAKEAGKLEPAPVRVFYPLMDARELHAYFPEAEIDTAEGPLEPGWYAVNIQAEILLPAIYRTGPEHFTLHKAYREAGLPWLKRLLEIQARGEDHGFLAGTFHLYRIRPSQGS